MSSSVFAESLYPRSLYCSWGSLGHGDDWLPDRQSPRCNLIVLPSRHEEGPDRGIGSKSRHIDTRSSYLTTLWQHAKQTNVYLAVGSHTEFLLPWICFALQTYCLSITFQSCLKAKLHEQNHLLCDGYISYLSSCCSLVIYLYFACTISSQNLTPMF